MMDDTDYSISTIDIKDGVYRSTLMKGDDKIIRFSKNTNNSSLAYFSNNKCIFIESDEDGDGFYDSILIITGDGAGECWMLKRNKDFSVTPLSRLENENYKNKNKDAAQRMKTALESYTENPAQDTGNPTTPPREESSSPPGVNK